MYIAFDFDGALVEHKYPLIGEKIEANINLLLNHKLQGDIIIIWTCRHGEDLIAMKRWLDDEKIPYDYINENPDLETGSRKIYADFYYDDRNLALPVQKYGLFYRK